MVGRKTRNVSLTPYLEAFIDRQVAQGRFRSASELVRAALRLLQAAERRPQRGQATAIRLDLLPISAGGQRETMQDQSGFLAGGGEMGSLMRAHDWTATPLGLAQGWPQALRTAVQILLNSRHPMFIWWGSELIQFYNDAYRRTVGPERHPVALGQGGRDCWAEI